MSSIDDRAESEISYGSCDHDWSVGSAPGSTGPGVGTGPGSRKNIAAMREKHSQCLQVLRKKGRANTDAGPQNLKVPPQIPGAPEPELTRQATQSSLADSDRLSRLTTPALVNEETEESVEVRVAQVQEESTMYFGRMREAVDAQGKALEQLKDEEVAIELGELRAVMAECAKQLEQLPKQETQMAIREVRESLEMCDKMGAQRLQDLHAALDRLREAVKAQGREIEGIKAQAPQQALHSIQERLEAQGQGFFNAVGPALQAVCESVVDTQKMACAQAAELEAIAQQFQSQQQEHSDELQKLRAAMVMQAQCSVMRSEIDSLKRKEAALESAANVPQSAVPMKAPAATERDMASVQDDFVRQHSEAVQQHLTERGEILARLRSWQNQAQVASSRMPREAISLGVAALVGGLVPVLVSSVLRSFWSSSALVPVVGLKVPHPPSAREPLGRRAGGRAGATPVREGRGVAGWRHAALAAVVTLGRWSRRPARKALL